MHSRRVVYRKLGTRIAIGAVVLFVVVLGVWWWLRAPDQITVVSWGGDYERAQADVLFHPYTDESGTIVHVELYGGGLADLEREVASPTPGWDVVDFELPDAAEACRKGLLETIDPAALPAGDNGAAATADFVPGAIGRCWVGSVVYAQIIAFDPVKFTGAVPQRAADYFDLAAFPGGRGMKDAPKGNLELALLASGVTPKDVYTVLSTPEGVARAFAKLDTIRAAIQWWHSSDDAVALLTSGHAVMTTALNGRIEDAVAKEHRRFGIIWDGERYELDVFGIPRGTPNKDNALDFIRWATGTKPLARVAGLLPYGPARLSSVLLVPVRTHAVGIPMDRVLTQQQSAENWRANWPSPTAHIANGVYLDPDWWAEHGPAIEARWRDWRSQP